MTPEQQKVIAIANARKRQAEGPPVENEDGFSVREMVGNIPSSAGQLASDMVNPILNPIDTAKNTYNLLKGVAQKAIPGEQGEEMYADAVGQFIKDRYGSWDNALNTIEQDPVGFLADASGLLTGGGMILPRATGKLSQTLMEVGKAIDPVNIASNTVGYGVGKAIPKDMPAGMYESSAKFSTTLTPEERSRLSRTALDERLMPTAKGLGELNIKVGELGRNIDRLIDTATVEGVEIPKSRVFQYLRDVRQELGGPRLTASQDLRKVDKLAKDFDVYMKRIGKDTLTPRELQSFKQDAYKQINWNKTQGTASYAKEQASKAMARAAKDELEKVSPEIRDLNARQGRLLELQPQLERSAARIDNRDMIGIGMPIKAAAGQAAGGSLGAGAATAAAVMDIPQVKARTAIMADQLRKSGAGIYGQNQIAPVITRQALMQQGRLNQEMEQDPIIRALRSQPGGQF